MHRSAVTFLSGLIGLTSSTVLAQPAPELTDETFEHWRSYIEPSEDEQCWQDIPWRESLYQGLQDSQIEGKPILLWAMNGHPLGCV